MTYAFHYLAVRAAPCLGINCISRYVLSCSDTRCFPLPDNVNFLRHVSREDAAKRFAFTRLLGLHRLGLAVMGAKKARAGTKTKPKNAHKSIRVAVFICLHEVISRFRCKKKEKKTRVSKCPPVQRSQSITVRDCSPARDKNSNGAKFT